MGKWNHAVSPGLWADFCQMTCNLYSRECCSRTNSLMANPWAIWSPLPTSSMPLQTHLHRALFLWQQITPYMFNDSFTIRHPFTGKSFGLVSYCETFINYGGQSHIATHGPCHAKRSLMVWVGFRRKESMMSAESNSESLCNTKRRMGARPYQRKDDDVQRPSFFWYDADSGH